MMAIALQSEKGVLPCFVQVRNFESKVEWYREWLFFLKCTYLMLLRGVVAM